MGEARAPLHGDIRERAREKGQQMYQVTQNIHTQALIPLRLCIKHLTWGYFKESVRWAVLFPGLQMRRPDPPKVIYLISGGAGTV